MKKLLCILLAVIMLSAIMCGCAKKPAETDAPASAAPAESQQPAEASEPAAPSEESGAKKVLFSTSSLEGGLSIFDEILRPAFESYGYEYECVSCDNDAVKQIEQVENAVVQGYDLIYIFAVNGEALADACGSAMDSGVRIFTFLNDTVNYDILFFDDPANYGKNLAGMALEWVSKAFPDAEEGSVNAAIFGCSNDDNNVIISSTVREVIHADPRINVLEDYDIEYSTSAAQAAAENVMTMHPDQQINLWIGIAAIITDGINAAVTAENSGAGDISKIGAIAPSPLNQEVVDKLVLAQENKTIIRGIMCTGGDLVENCNNIVAECDKLLSGEEVEPIMYSPIDPVWYEDLPAYGY